MRKLLAVTLLLVPMLVSAQPIRQTGLTVLPQWEDPIQLVQPELPVGPYALRAFPSATFDELWVGFRADRTTPLPDGRLTANWTPLTNQLTHTLYTDLAAYRQAWWLASQFAVFGPACYCWDAVQGSIFHTLGLPGANYYEHLLLQAQQWDATVGRFADWSSAYVVTDQAQQYEWILGAPTVLVLPEPELPEPDIPEPDIPPTPVSEPAAMVLFMLGCAVLGVFAGMREW